jgi:hypothetical protein
VNNQRFGIDADGNHSRPKLGGIDGADDDGVTILDRGPHAVSPKGQQYFLTTQEARRQSKNIATDDHVFILAAGNRQSRGSNRVRVSLTPTPRPEGEGSGISWRDR